MNKNGETNISLLVITFIGVIFALVLFPTIANGVQVMTTKYIQVNETIDLSLAKIEGGNGEINSSYIYTLANAAPANDWRQTNCPLESFTLHNTTSAFTDTTDYVVNLANGTVLIQNTLTTNGSDNNNETYVNYTFCDTGYITGSGGRGVVGIILIFSALAIMGFVIWGALSKTGWLDK